MPGVLRTHLLRGPVVRTTNGGNEHRLPSTSDFEIIIAVTSRTQLPRTALFGSVQWLPNASATRNPFTLYTASELGSPVRANAPTLTTGASFTLLSPQTTHGWFDAAFNVGALFSQAARPRDRSAYTHKLDLDLLARPHVFARTPPHTYIHQVVAYAILDYVATGLPAAGDEVPVGRVFVTRARPLALIAGLTFPLTPPSP